MSTHYHKVREIKPGEVAEWHSITMQVPAALVASIAMNMGTKHGEQLAAVEVTLTARVFLSEPLDAACKRQAAEAASLIDSLVKNALQQAREHEKR